MLNAVAELPLTDPQIEPASFPFARPIAFAMFANKYAGRTCYVIGRGPTTFDYKKLGDITDPIFFINDAVCLEKFARSQTFFFAHDIEMRAWLDGSMKSTAVLPVNGTILGDAPGVVLNHAGPIAFYYRQDEDREALMRMSRDELAVEEALFGHSGTIHSLLHFIWYCGFTRVIYIGCDGINQKNVLAHVCGSQDGYDARLPNHSHTSPDWNYQVIRRVQDLLQSLLGLETTHLGTPV